MSVLPIFNKICTRKALKHRYLKETLCRVNTPPLVVYVMEIKIFIVLFFPQKVFIAILAEKITKCN